MQRLRLVQAIHTAIYLVMASSVLVVLVAGITGYHGAWLWVSGVLVAGESVVFAGSGMKCPLTAIAVRYSPKSEASDTFLPARCTRHTLTVFGPLILLGSILVSARYWPYGIPLMAFAALLTAASLARKHFTDRLDAIDLVLVTGPASEGPRRDLPAEVWALAVRLGADPSMAPRAVTLVQAGHMWRSPGGQPLAFSARQTAAVSKTGFLSRATMAPAKLISVADSFVDGRGALEVRLLGVVPLVLMAGAAMDRGEALRYLAELPWNPDAILMNRSLEWTVSGADTLQVAVGDGAERAEITLHLNSDGLADRVSAQARPYAVKGGFILLPWRGRFWDFGTQGGRLLPRQGEVAWVIEGKDFVYWRGRLIDWSLGASIRP